MKRFIYVLRPVGAEGPLKIGCSCWPWGRLKTLAAWSPVPLELAAMAPGDFALEERLHAKFEHLRLHGEWFRAEPELLKAVEALARGVLKVDALPARKRLPVKRNVTPEARKDIGLAHKANWMRKWGYPIPPHVREALEGRYQAMPEVLASKRAVVNEFVAAHYGHAREMRAAKRANDPTPEHNGHAA